MSVEAGTGQHQHHHDAQWRGVALHEALEDYRTAWVSRCLDDREILLQKQSQVFFQISGAGHEALGLALARSLRSGHDWFFPYYRDQALVLGLGATAHELLLQAVGAAADPASAGRQMPNHWGSPVRHIASTTSPTASQCLPAVGCAEAGRYITAHDLTGAERDEVTMVSLGDGASSEGEFHEALNTACTLELPVLFVVADNGWAISVPARDQAPAPISELVSGYPQLHCVRADGCEYFELRPTVDAAVARLRQGRGPVLLHATVTRPYSHSAADTQSKYRTGEELSLEVDRDPLRLWRHELESAGVPAHELDDLEADARREVLEASDRATASPKPDPATVLEHRWALPELPECEQVGGGEATMTFSDAVRVTLSEVMEADETVRVFGEDVADAPQEVVDRVEGKGGVFGTTLGLQRRFGADRCFNTPLAEANIVGRAVGQALRGLHPAPEIQFFDYVWPAMTQIRSEAATTRWRSAGSFTCPMVLRVPCGGYLTGGAIWHSQSGEGVFAHIPGLAVVMPSRAQDVVGMLRYAFRCQDPVLFLEHKHLLRQPYAASPPVGPGHLVPFGSAAVRRAGDDVTVVTWGATVQRALWAADELAERDGVEVEVVDLRSISPWDHDTVAASVARTHRVLVLHEDTLFAGFGGEVAAWVAEHCFEQLDAPVGRMGALDCFVPYQPGLEHAVLPQSDGIAERLRQLTAY